MNINKIFCGISVAFLSLVFTACSEKQALERHFYKGGCEAVNLDSLLLSKSRAVKFIDFRNDEERNYHNSLWTAKEYCNMSNFTLNQIVAAISEKTGYNNLITIKNTNFVPQDEKGSVVVTIEDSKRKYATKRNFNFVALKDANMQYFKEGESITFGGKSVKIYSVQEYRYPSNLWKIKIVGSDGDEALLELKKNYFILNGYKIIF